jgi:hypothetical protein
LIAEALEDNEENEEMAEEGDDDDDDDDDEDDDAFARGPSNHLSNKNKQIMMAAFYK